MELSVCSLLNRATNTGSQQTKPGESRQWMFGSFPKSFSHGGKLQRRCIPSHLGYFRDLHPLNLLDLSDHRCVVPSLLLLLLIL